MSEHTFDLGVGPMITRRRPAPLGDRPIHNRVARLRGERGLTRLELADAVGVHYQTVGYIERGEYAPSLHVALRIAEALDLPLEVVFSTQPFPDRD